METALRGVGAPGGRMMQGFLGEKIDGGASADIHVWARGLIVKLFKAGVPERFGRHEARMTRAAFAAGAPEVFDEVTVHWNIPPIPTIPPLPRER
jgi:hypothetical protein